MTGMWFRQISEDAVEEDDYGAEKEGRNENYNRDVKENSYRVTSAKSFDSGGSDNRDYGVDDMKFNVSFDACDDNASGYCRITENRKVVLTISWNTIRVLR